MLIKRFGLNFLLGSLDNNVRFLVKKAKQQRGMIVLPCSLNDLANADKKTWQNYYHAIDYCTTDGMPLVWYFRSCQKNAQLKNFKIERNYGPDLMRRILKESPDRQHFFCGSSPATLRALKKQIIKLNPQLKTAHFYSPPFSPQWQFSNQLVEKLQKTQTEILWLGLPSPKQVRLASAIQKRCPNLKIFCVGAAFDYLAKSKKQAPLIWQKLGLEWFYRLLHEPKRLARRYLLDIPFFLFKKFWHKLIRLVF